MNKTINRGLKQYFKEIRLLLPIYSSAERKFLKALRTSVVEYIEQNPECTMEDIYENFDEPEDAVYNYISALDYHRLCRAISVRRLLKSALLVLLIIALLTALFWVWTWFSLYLEAKSHIVTEIVTVIE